MCRVPTHVCPVSVPQSQRCQSASLFWGILDERIKYVKSDMCSVSVSQNGGGQNVGEFWLPR